MCEGKIEVPKCPECGEELTKIKYKEYGVKVFENGTYEESPDLGELEAECPHCDAELDFDFLSEIRF